MGARIWDAEVVDPDGGEPSWRRVAAKDEFGARVIVENAGLSVGRVQPASRAVQAQPLAAPAAARGDARASGAVALAWVSLGLAIVMPVVGLPLAVAATVSGAKTRKATEGRAGGAAFTVGIVAVVIACLALVGWASAVLLRAASSAP